MGRLLNFETGHMSHSAAGCIAAQEQALCIHSTLEKRVWQVEPLFLTALLHEAHCAQPVGSQPVSAGTLEYRGA